MYQFLYAFTTNVLSFVTLYMDVEFNTLPVERGHKKRHGTLDNFATVWRKRQRSINLMLKLYWNNKFFATIQNISSSVAKFCLELPWRFFISKVAFIRQTEVSNLVLSNGIWHFKTFQKQFIFACLKVDFAIFFHANLSLTVFLVKMTLDKV